MRAAALRAAAHTHECGRLVLQLVPLLRVEHDEEGMTEVRPIARPSGRSEHQARSPAAKKMFPGGWVEGFPAALQGGPSYVQGKCLKSF